MFVYLVTKLIVKNPRSFCVDEADNIIVTDSGTDSIKFFSPDGEDLHQIGGDKVGSDVVRGAIDIVTYGNKIIVSCDDGRILIY